MAERSRKSASPKHEAKPKKAAPQGPTPAGVESSSPTGPGPAADPSLLRTSGTGPSLRQQDLLLALQRGFGNRAVDEMLRRSKPALAPKQPQALLSPSETASALAARHQGAGGVLQFDGKKKGAAAAKAPDPIKAVIYYAQAQLRHVLNVVHLETQVLAPGRGKKTDLSKGPLDFTNLYINSVEWIDKGRSKLFALTKPHDWKERQKATGKSEIPYFPKPPSKSTAYDLDPAKGNDAFDWNAPGVLGWRSAAGNIAVIEPKSRPAGELKKTLVHEVQHDADFHTKMKSYHAGGIKTMADKADRALNRYQSEYRAYWVANGPSYGSPKTKAGMAPYKSERHKRIASHILGGYKYAWEAFHAKYESPAGSGKFKAWDSKVGGKTFKKWVYGYSKPEGLNLANSVRIAVLLEKLQRPALKAGTAKWTVWAKAVKKAALGLKQLDRDCIADAPAVQNLINTKLAGEVLGAIQGIVYVSKAG